MLKELLLISFLWGPSVWSAPDTHNRAVLSVECNQVLVKYNGVPRARKAIVTFWQRDEELDYMWKYSVPMKVNSNGYIILEPSEYFIEEVKRSRVLSISIDGNHFSWGLTGTKKALSNCKTGV